MGGSSNVVFVLKRTLADPEEKLATPHLINLDADPKEQEPYNYPHMHTWVMAHVGKMLEAFAKSVEHEPLIPAGAPLDYVPNKK